MHTHTIATHVHIGSDRTTHAQVCALQHAGDESGRPCTRQFVAAHRRMYGSEWQRQQNWRSQPWLSGGSKPDSPEHTWNITAVLTLADERDISRFRPLPGGRLE